MYEETEQAIMNAGSALSRLADLISGDNQNRASVTKLYEESSRIHDRRSQNRDGGRVTVRAWRIDLPMLPWKMRKLYAVQQFLASCDWEEAENELDTEWSLLTAEDYQSDATVIRHAIDLYDELGPELAQRVFDRVTAEMAHREKEADRDFPF